MGDKNKSLHDLATQSTAPVTQDTSTSEVPSIFDAAKQSSTPTVIHGTEVPELSRPVIREKGVDINDPQYTRKLNERQSAGEMVKNVFAGGAKLFGAGVLDGIASWDITDMAGLATGTEKEYGNTYHDMAKSLRESAQENNPIYEKDPGSVSPSDPAWWASQIQQQLYSAGIIVEGGVEALGTGLATGGTGEIAEAAKLSRSAQMIRKILPTIASRAKMGEALYGVFNGLKEATINQYDTYDETYKAYIDKGMSDKEATHYASIAASDGWRKEVGPMMLIKALEYGAMSYNPVTRKSTGFFDKIENKIARTAATGTFEVGMQGFEEGYQTFAQAEGRAKADYLSGQMTQQEYANRFGKEFSSDDMWNSIIGGMMGGVIFSGAGYLKNKIRGDVEGKAMEAQYQDFKSKLTGQTLDYVNQIGKAKEEGNEGKVKRLQREMAYFTALSSHHMDQLNESTDAYDSHISFLQGTLKAIQNNDAETLAKLNIKPEDHQNIQDTFPQYLKDAERMKDLYNNLTAKNIPEAVVPLAYRQFELEKLQEELGLTQAEIDQTKAKIVDHNNLSDIGKFLFEAQYNLENYKREEARLQKLRKVTTDAKEIAGIDESLNNIGIQRQIHENFISKLKEDDDRLGSDKMKDDKILKTIPHNVDYDNAVYKKTQIESGIERTRKEIEIWNSPVFQKNISKGNITGQIKQANDVKTLDAIKEKLKNSNQLSADFEAIIENKKQTIAAKEVADKAKQDKKNAKPVNVVPAPPVAAPTTKTNQVNPTATSTNGVPSNTPSNGGNEAVTPANPNLSPTPDTIPNGTDIFGSANLHTDNEEQLTPNSRQGLAQDILTPQQGMTIDENGHIVVAEESLFEPKSLFEPGVESSAYYAGMKNKIANYYQTLAKDLGIEPTFEQLIDDLINNSNRETVKSVWTPVLNGWEANGYKATNYAKAYEDFFNNRKVLAQEIVDFAREGAPEVTPAGQQQSSDSGQQTIQQTNATPAQVTINEEGMPVYSHLLDSETAEGSLKLAHLSMTYVQELEGKVATGELNEGQYVNNKLLMQPGQYGVGTQLTVRIPDNPNEIMVANWNKDFTKGPGQTFGQWAEARGIQEGSKEWMDKIPMIAYDAQGNAVAFIHDTEWYNPENVKFDDQPETKAKIIKDGQDTVSAFRNHVHGNNGTVRVQITEKKLGIKYQIPEDQPRITINEANPHARMGFGTDAGTIRTHGGELITPDQLVNSKDVIPGTDYDVREADLDNNPNSPNFGKMKYMAFPAIGGKHSSEAKVSIVKAFEVFLSQYNDDPTSFSSREKMEPIRAEIERITGYNLHNPAHLYNYLSQFIYVHKGEGSHKDIFTSVSSNSKYKQGSPFLSLDQKTGTIVYGFIGQKMDANNEYYYLFPGSLKPKDNTEAGQKRDPHKGGKNAYVFLQTLFEKIVPQTEQEIGRHALDKNPTVGLISKEGNVTEGKKYHDYVKDNFLTNVKSFNVGTAEKPVYATFLQPVVNFKPVSEINKPAPAPAQLAAQQPEKIAPKEDTLDPNEGVINEIEAMRTWLKNSGASDADIDAAIQNIKDKKSAPKAEPTYELDTDDVVNRAKVGMGGVEGIQETHRSEMVRFIARQVENEIEGTKKIDRPVISDAVKDSFNKMVGVQKQQDIANLAQVKGMQERTGIDMSPLIAPLEKRITDIKKVEDHWEELIQEALDNEVSRNTGIKQLKYTDSAMTARELIRLREEKGIFMDDNEVALIEKLKDRTAEASEADKKALQELYDNVLKLMPDDAIETQAEEDRPEGTVDELADTGDEREKDHSQTSLEENHKISVSALMKRFLSQIPEYQSDGTIARGFLNVPKYPGFDHYSDLLSSILTSPVETEPDYDQMVQRLEQFKDSQHWIADLLDRLDKAGMQMKAAFVYHYAMHSLSSKFIMYGENRKTGEWNSRVYDTNAGEIIRVITTQWNNNLKKVGGILNPTEDGGYSINKTKAKELLDKLEEWKAKRATSTSYREVVSVEEAKSWLSNFGIELSTESVKELMDKGYTINEGKSFSTYSFDRMFRISNQTNGIFGLLGRKLELAMKAADGADIMDNEKLHPFSDASAIIKKLAAVEKKFTQHVTTNSFRDGNKSIYGITPGKMATQMMVKLRLDDAFRQSKLGLPFDGNSMILSLMETDSNFRGKVKLDHIGINALKEQGKKLYKDNELNQLSDADHEFTRLSFLFDRQQGTIVSHEIKIGNEIHEVPMRIARMMFPTMSDKSTMLDLTTAVVDFTNKDESLFTNVNGEINVNDAVKGLLYSQLVQPELNRIVSHHKLAYERKSHPDLVTNQSGYNKGAQIFHMVPELNNVTYQGVRLIQYLAEHPEALSEKEISNIQEEIKDQVDNILDNLLKKEVEASVKLWKENGYVITDNEGKTVGHKLLDDDYMRSHKGDAAERVQKAAYDYVVNSFISNANMYMLFAGDIANYVTDKAFSQDLFEDKVPYKPLNNNAYAEISENKIGVNVGKRLALLIAPGKSLFNATKDSYVQLFLADRQSASTNVKFLVDLFYKGSVTEEQKTLLDMLDTVTDPKMAKDVRSKLADEFPEIGDYFNIESTDAQEYTTAKEALDVIYRQGRLSDTLYQDMSQRLSRQYKAEKAGNAIDPADFLSDDELKMVFNPVKPVYAGQIINPHDRVARMVYIKSSSFPLLPQTTMGTELNGLRRQMEELQDRTGKNVRASYGSANKVGSVLGANELSIWDEKGNYIPMDVNDLIAQHDNPQAALSLMTLPRENFRIQQDVPFKSSKRLEDTVSIGSQMMKLIFGDGISKMDGKVFELNGQQVSGRELYEHYTKHFNMWVSNEKANLYDKLGINEQDGKSKDIAYTTEQLRKILVEEATGRGYPRQDIEALGVEHMTDSNGKVVDVQFTIPVWLSPNSNRYEALLNAIVANRLINLKMPGNSYVVGSEEGFKMTEAEYKGDKSKTIYVKGYDPTKGLQATSMNEDGTIRKAQVMVPSKFRDSKGKLVDLFAKDKTGNYIYVETSAGHFTLKEGMIDPSLMNMSSFRIPTSGHVSMSQVEIVGFLPFEQGDLMLVPKNFTKQKGLDFDVDKENTYMQWHTVDRTGKIHPIRPEENSGNRRQASKLSQNEIIKSYAAVLSSPHRDVQQKINRVLSMDFAKSQAELIQGLTQQTKDNQYFTPLSNAYQKTKMGLGATGKMGIGVYSNYVVFHGLVQQATSEVGLTRELLDSQGAGTGKFVSLDVNIGRFSSDGKLGNQMTLDGSRSIASMFGERQNTATDNEKEQIMGRVGINSLTINVDSLLSALGFDKDTATVDGKKVEISVPYFLLSQPIIQEYVNKMRNAKSTIAEFDKNAQETVIADLLAKYGGNMFTDKDGNGINIRGLEQDKVNNLRAQLTGQELVDGITTPKNSLQQSALHLFLELDKYAEQVAKVQKKLNLQRTGLGKSAFEMIEKYEGVKSLTFNPMISNVRNLVGDFITGREFDSTSLDTLHEKGYTIFDGFAVKPTTPVGAILVNGTKAGYELFKDFFPYQHSAVQGVMKEIMNVMAPQENEAKRVEIKMRIFQEIKSYLYTSNKLKLHNGNPQEERARLFFDRKNEDGTIHHSLATYLSGLSKLTGEGAQLVAANQLISRFKYQLESNGMPSLVQYDNTKGEDVNEEYKYAALMELMDNNVSLPDYNGKPYTTRMLAKDLVVYSFLQGGLQKANEFIKYIPVSYLKAIGFTGASQVWQRAGKGMVVRKASTGEAINVWEDMLGYNGSKILSRFTRQFFQHNPDMAQQVKKEDLVSTKYGNTNGISDLLGFQVKGMTTPPPFLSIYNNRLNTGSKHQLYMYNGIEYLRIPTLKVSGMSQYSIYDKEVHPLIKQSYLKNVTQGLVDGKIVPDDSNPKRETLFEMSSGNLSSIVNNIANTNIPGISQVARAFFPFINQDSKLKIGETIADANATHQTLTTMNPATGAITRKGHITVNPTYINNPAISNERIATTVIHEVAHDLTRTEMEKYFNNDGSFLPGITPPAHITKLQRLFYRTQEHLGPKLAEFMTHMNNNKTLRNNSTEEKLNYAASDIHEFVAVVMAEPEVQKILNEVKYASTDKTYWQQFVETITGILKAVGVNINQDGITYQTLEAVLAMVDSTQQNTTKTDGASFGGIDILGPDENSGPRDTNNPFDSSNFDGQNPFAEPTVHDIENVLARLDKNC